MPNNESVYLVRHIVTDQQGDRVIGIFTKLTEAVKYAKAFNQRFSNWDWVDVEEIPLNLYMDENYEDDLYREVF